MQNKTEDLNKLSFYLNEENKFFIEYFNGDFPIIGKYHIVDYFTDNLIYCNQLNIHNLSLWFKPTETMFGNHLIKNGYYFELRDENNDIIAYRTTGITDPEKKHPLSKVYNRLRKNSLSMDNEMKFLEFSFFKDMYLYNDLKLPIEKIKTFIDAGANFGMFGLSLYDLGAKKGYFVEADPRLVKLMNENINIEGIEIIGKALYNENSFMEFNIFEGSVVGRIKTDNNSNLTEDEINSLVTTVKVPTIDINDFINNIIKEEKIDLFKIDIEGGEYPVFEKITDENLNKSESYLIEFHDNYDGRVSKLITKLCKNGYSMQFLKWDPWDSHDILNNKQGIIYAFKR